VTIEAAVATLLVNSHANENAFFEARLRKWLRDSHRFAVFVDKYSNTIRSKIVNASSQQDLWDVFYELEVGYYLCLDEDIQILAYQPTNTNKSNSRNPDYFAIFKGKEEFYLEVARIRDVEEESRPPMNDINGVPIEGAWELVDRTHKIKDVLFSKLTQMAASKANVIFIFSESPDFSDLSIQQCISYIGRKVKSGNENYFRHKKWDGSGAEYFLNAAKDLSAIVLRTTWREQKTERIKGAHVPISPELASHLENLRGLGEESGQEYRRNQDARLKRR
jgi:hypothetical protein